MKFLFALLAFALTLFAAEPIVIVGGGVGGLTAALYLARSGHTPIVLEGPQRGGLIAQSHSVQNWPGEQEISGPALAERLRAQAKENGAEILSEELISVDLSKRPFTLKTRTRTLQAESLILAMGTRPNFLGVPGEQTFWGRGVSNCAVCDGSLYKDKVVGVVGGGDAAVLEALYLSNIAREVRVFVRKGEFRATEQKRLAGLHDTPNIKVFLNTSVQEIRGNDEGVTEVLVSQAEQKRSMPLDGLFLAIGSTPNTALLKGLELDPKGYIVLRNTQQTSIPGVYAVGDIADPHFKQAISAAGDGAKAALQAERFLSDGGHSPVAHRKALELKEPTSNVVEIANAEHFQRELTESDGPVFVDFYATWCGPCKQIAPIVERLSALLAPKVKFLKVDVDRLMELSRRYKIRSMPTALLLDEDGEVVERQVGSEAITKMLEALELGHAE